MTDITPPAGNNDASHTNAPSWPTMNNEPIANANAQRSSKSKSSWVGRMGKRILKSRLFWAAAAFYTVGHGAYYYQTHTVQRGATFNLKTNPKTHESVLTLGKKGTGHDTKLYGVFSGNPDTLDWSRTFILENDGEGGVGGNIDISTQAFQDQSFGEQVAKAFWDNPAAGWEFAWKLTFGKGVASAPIIETMPVQNHDDPTPDKKGDQFETNNITGRKGFQINKYGITALNTNPYTMKLLEDLGKSPMKKDPVAPQQSQGDQRFGKQPHKAKPSP